MNNKKTSPYTLRIFVANEDPEGLRIITDANWTGEFLKNMMKL